MIRTLADPETELIWRHRRSRKLPPDIQRSALRKLIQIDAADELSDLRVPPANRLEQLKGFEPLRYSIAATTNGGSPSAGPAEARTMSGSRIITEDDGPLPTIHPGEVLREDFLIGSTVPAEEVAQGARLDAAILGNLLEGRIAVDAAIDLRLGRYFGVSEGFFLRLQNHYDLEAERRTHADELARITPRAA